MRNKYLIQFFNWEGNQYSGIRFEISHAVKDHLASDRKAGFIRPQCVFPTGRPSFPPLP